jgi:hypothetical protein
VSYTKATLVADHHLLLTSASANTSKTHHARKGTARKADGPLLLRSDRVHQSSITIWIWNVPTKDHLLKAWSPLWALLGRGYSLRQ